MINLRRDLFVRLAISAHKKQYLNNPFRVSHIDVKDAPTHITLDFDESNSLEKELSRLPVMDTKTPVVVAKPVQIILPGPRTVKIEEKIDSIVNDPAIIEMQIELEFAEQLLKKVKDADTHNPKIPIIEETISRLRILLNQKIYV